MSEGNKGRRIQDLTSDERPRERLMALGPQALSVPELIAILLGSGTLTKSAIEVGADLFLNEASQSLKEMARFDASRYMRISGIGPAKAVTLIAAFELARRKELEVDDRTHVAGTKEAYALFKPRLADLDHEEAWAMFLNRSSRLLRIERISRGTSKNVLFDVKAITRAALDVDADAVICAHNHPGGVCRASREDIAITSQMQGALALFQIRLLDHLILTQTDYYSMRSHGELNDL
ncbi:MAG: hypothetical protein CSA97_03675 [Bacteroidetes bacterium]|nr:MAG: hypothetical protein CSA97_03675 [Bacteroidota bacterium]